jgi:energy-coupling factor transporter ATP-binding protein EcfA2
VWCAQEALVAEVKANPILVVVGETGSGKTTQVRGAEDGGAGVRRGGQGAVCVCVCVCVCVLGKGGGDVRVVVGETGSGKTTQVRGVC